jgi:hypothetical protein
MPPEIVAFEATGRALRQISLLRLRFIRQLLAYQ